MFVFWGDGSEESKALVDAIRVTQLTEAFRKGTIDVFRGDYTGADPQNPADTIDLNKGFTENEHSSAPSFHYVLDGVIEVEN